MSRRNLLQGNTLRHFFIDWFRLPCDHDCPQEAFGSDLPRLATLAKTGSDAKILLPDLAKCDRLNH